MDDLIMKTKEHDAHLEAMCKVLDYLLEYDVQLNHKNYVFRVLSGKILWFIVSKRGILVDPNKGKAFNDMPPIHNLN